MIDIITCDINILQYYLAVTLPPKTGPFDKRVLLFILTVERGTFHEEPVYRCAEHPHPAAGRRRYQSQNSWSRVWHLRTEFYNRKSKKAGPDLNRSRRLKGPEFKKSNLKRVLHDIEL